jgi:hypothetical protein
MILHHNIGVNDAGKSVWKSKQPRKYGRVSLYYNQVESQATGNIAWQESFRVSPLTIR